MVRLCIKLYSAAIATADSIASAIIPVTSQLVLVSWSALGNNAGAVGGSEVFQLATQSTAQATTNDARNIVDEMSFGFTAAANIFYNDNKVTPIAGIKFSAGDKIYLHLTAVQALAVSRINVNLIFA